jgi:hypothetical protein
MAGADPAHGAKTGADRLAGPRSESCDLLWAREMDYDI